MRKGQAALEFLTTYAWAFLVILIMIGALAYFGILNPSKLLPDRCNMGSEIGCEDFAASYGTGADGTVNLKLKNNFGEPIIVNSLSVGDPDGGFTCAHNTPSTANLQAGNVQMGTGSNLDVVLDTCTTQNAGFIQGDKAKFTVAIGYYAAKSDATYAKNVSGEVFVQFN